MKLTIKAKYHVTATQKRHIAELLEAGLVKGGTKTMQYRFTGEGVVECYKKETAMNGSTFWRKDVMTYEFA